MRTLIATAFFAVSLLPAWCAADELALPESDEPAAAPTPAPPLPKRGATQAEVVKNFGEPATKHPAVGGDSPKHPPITRWDYPGFSVFFEHSHVVNAVVPGRPAPLYHTDQLKPGEPTASADS